MPTFFSRHHRALCAIGLTGFAISSVAQQPLEVDRLTEQWLALEAQTSQLKNDWVIEEPMLSQRKALLQAEKQQLIAILDNNQASSGDVEARRTELLAEQAQLEQQQQQLSRGSEQLTRQLQTIATQLPPPLLTQWQQEQQALGDDPALSERLQVSIAQLSRLAEFDSRLSLHQAPVETDGGSIQVKQLYLGVGIAWFSSEDGQYRGWGQASQQGWQWHVEPESGSAEIQRAIAIYERRQQADLVRLPIHLESQP